MKAIQLAAIKRVELIDLPKPEIKNDDDVLIKVMRVGICGSDIHYYKTGKIGDQNVKYPFIIGHEMSGIVEQAGPNVKNVKPGDRVAVDPLVNCNQCDQCRIGRYHTCRNQKFLGGAGQLAGCMTEYVVMPRHLCYKVPDSISFANATLCEPLAISYYTTSFCSQITGKSVGILGVGPIGLGVLIVCTFLKAKRIYITDKLDYRLKIAQKQGAAWAGNPLKCDIVKNINQLEPNGLDYVFECCGQQQAVDQAIDILKPGGKLLIIGIPAFLDYSFQAHIMRRKEIAIQNVRRQNKYTQKTINLVAKKKVNPGFMVTHTYQLAQTESALKLVAGYKDGVIKAMIKLD